MGKITPLPCGQLRRAKAKGVYPDRNSVVEPNRQMVGKIDHLLATLHPGSSPAVLTMSCYWIQKAQDERVSLSLHNFSSLKSNSRACHVSDTSERRTALVAKELACYKVDIAALSETHLPDEGQLMEHGCGYTFFWSGCSDEEWRESGVGFAIKSQIVKKLANLPKGISDRLMTPQLPLGHKSCNSDQCICIYHD